MVLKAVESRRNRQQSVVDMLDKYRAQADSGEIVGALVFYVRRDGTFGHGRDIFNSDIATVLGHIHIYAAQFARDYSDRFSAPENLPPAS